jgi:hypothetical protein
MNFKKILLLCHSCANLNQTLLKWTLGGPLWKLCPSVPFCIQDGGTFWLKIEQFWPFEEISIFSHGSHLGYRTALTDTFWKGTTQGSFQQSLVENSSPLTLLCQSQSNFAEMNLGWSPLKIVSVSTVLYPRWPPWLKIEISSNGQNFHPPFF